MKITMNNVTADVPDHELQKLIDAYTVSDKWPKEGDGTWYVNGCGEVGKMYFDSNNSIDIGWKDQGRIFRTKEGAELFAKQGRVKATLRRMAKGFVPDWSDHDQVKFCIVNGDRGWGAADWKVIFTVGQIYFATKQDAEAAIDAVRDDIDCLLEVAV